MSGYVRDQLTSATIANARLDLVSGVNAGKTAWSDLGGLYRVSIWGVAAGTALVTGRYFGVSSPARPVQVVPR